MDKQILIDLKRVSQILEKRKEELASKQAEFMEANKELFENIKASNEVIESYKETIRCTVLSEYAEDGVKSRIGGIGVKVFKELKYDEKKAFEWAREKNLFLQLDTKGFEKFAKSGIIAFVDISEKPMVTFPKEIIIED